MKYLIIISFFMALLACSHDAHAQQVVDSPVQQKVIVTPGGFASAMDDMDMFLATKQQEEAFKVYNTLMEMLGQNIADLEAKVKTAGSDGERLMYTEKLKAQQKHHAKLKELSVQLLQNRNLVNLELKDALKNM